MAIDRAELSVPDEMQSLVDDGMLAATGMLSLVLGLPPEERTVIMQKIAERAHLRPIRNQLELNGCLSQAALILSGLEVDAVYSSPVPQSLEVKVPPVPERSVSTERGIENTVTVPLIDERLIDELLGSRRPVVLNDESSEAISTDKDDDATPPVTESEAIEPDQPETPDWYATRGYKKYLNGTPAPMITFIVRVMPKELNDAALELDPLAAALITDMLIDRYDHKRIKSVRLHVVAHFDRVRYLKELTGLYEDPINQTAIGRRYIRHPNSISMQIAKAYRGFQQFDEAELRTIFRLGVSHQLELTQEA
jgi:hypothetical protein